MTANKLAPELSSPVAWDRTFYLLGSDGFSAVATSVQLFRSIRSGSERLLAGFRVPQLFGA